MNAAHSLIYTDHITVLTAEGTVFWSMMPCGLVELKVFTAVCVKNAIFLDVALSWFILNRSFEGTCRLHLQGRRNNAIWVGLKVSVDKMEVRKVLQCQ
jgi:hypothetical protein